MVVEDRGAIKIGVDFPVASVIRPVCAHATRTSTPTQHQAPTPHGWLHECETCGLLPPTAFLAPEKERKAVIDARSEALLGIAALLL